MKIVVFGVWKIMRMACNYSPLATCTAVGPAEPCCRLKSSVSHCPEVSPTICSGNCIYQSFWLLKLNLQKLELCFLFTKFVARAFYRRIFLLKSVVFLASLSTLKNFTN